MVINMIKFGTDGWRAIIADDYTFANLERVSMATAQWVIKTAVMKTAVMKTAVMETAVKQAANDKPTVVIGHDTRFQGRAFAERSAAVLASAGLKVLMADGFTSTPAVSWATKEYGCAAGIVITASHNPPAYNGFKIKSPAGGPASPEQIAEVERILADLPDVPRAPESYDTLREQGAIEERDVRGGYLDIIRRRINIDAIRSAGFTVAHDAMFGAGQGLLSELLGADNVVELRSEFNPGFQGTAPEPIERSTQMLAEAVVAEGCAAGIANDGDADRIGMYDEQGNFVDSHKMLALLLKYLHDERGLAGKIVKTFSTTGMLDKMGDAYGLEVVTTPIGFKYIGPKMAEGGGLIGGVESGGLAVAGHLPERDGIYIGLLILEMMAARGRPVSALVDELSDEVGPHAFGRVDVRLTDVRKKQILHELDASGLQEIAGRPVERVDTLDGYKHFTQDGWLLVRPSGTEPVLRVYAEAETRDNADALIDGMMQEFELDGRE